MANKNIRDIFLLIILCALLFGVASAGVPYFAQSTFQKNNVLKYVIPKSGQEIDAIKPIKEDSLNPPFGTNNLSVDLEKIQYNVKSFQTIDQRVQRNSIQDPLTSSNSRIFPLLNSHQIQNPTSTDTQPSISVNRNDQAIQKIDDTTLQLLLDPNYRKTMDPNLNQIDGLANDKIWIKDPVLGEMVIIEIHLEPGSNTNRLEKYVYQVRSSWPEANVMIATVPLKDIYTLVSFPEVKRINLVNPGELA